MQQQELSLDMIHEFLNTELNAGFKRSGQITSSGYGTIEMAFHDRLKKSYAIVIDDYDVKNRGEIAHRINNAMKYTLVASRQEGNLYVIFNSTTFSKKDHEYFLDALSNHTKAPILYDSEFISNQINSWENPIQPAKEETIEEKANTYIYTHDELDKKNASEKVKEIDYDFIAKQIDLAFRIRNSTKSFWWINASKQFFDKQPIAQNDVYQYPIRINTGKRRANFSSLKIGDFLIGYDARGTKEVYAILCVVREDDTYVFLQVAYILDNPISWKQLSEIESYSNSIIIRSKATVTLNNLNPDQFIAIISKGISDPDSFSSQVLNKDFTLYEGDPYFGVDPGIHAEDKEAGNINAVLEENESIEANPITLKNNSSIASVIDDTPDGDDYLDIAEDVDAFAKVIALDDLPTPLSIALFGDWGSGKSFFMNQLEKRIKRIVKQQPIESSIFAKNIIHIRFNAWAYLDANLHASLASIIFEEIYNVVYSKDDIQNKIKKEEDKLFDELVLVKEAKERVNNELNFLTEKKENLKSGLQKEFENLKTCKENLLSYSEQHLIKEAYSKIEDELKAYLKEVDAEDLISSGNNLFLDFGKMIGEIKKTRFLLTNMFSISTLFFSIFLFTIISIVFYGIFYYLNYYKISDGFIIVPQIILGSAAFLGPFIHKASNIVRSTKSTLKKLNTIKSTFDQELEQKKILVENKIAKLEKEELEIHINIKIIESEIHELDARKHKVEQRLHQDNIVHEAFRTLIHDIHHSETYKKELGIISLLKKDFDRLSKLFTKQKNTDNKNIVGSEKIDRIVLYIDDLDRCSEEHVLSVIEAVHLLLAYKLFVVVVGVDHRWIKNALITKHHKLFGIKKNIQGYEPIEPNTYLEKIFQVPFHVKSASDDNIQKMISKLLDPNNIQNPTTNLGQAQNLPTKKQSKKSKSKGDTEDLIMGGSTISEEFISKQSSRDFTSALGLDMKTPEDIIEQLLVLNDEEKQHLPQFQFLLGNNPRTIKRYVNIYRIVRSHGGLPGGTNQTENNLIRMFLVALAIGNYKNSFYKLSEIWHLDSNKRTKINSIFENTGIESKIKSSIEQNNTIKFLLDLEDSKIRTIGLFIERFSFKNYKVNISQSNSLSEEPID